MKGRALILPPVNRNDAKVTEQLSDLDDSHSKAHCAMQYSKGRAIPIAVDQTSERLALPMLRLPSKQASLLILAFPALILAGCSDSLTGVAPSPPSYANSSKGLPKTLSPSQQKAAIAELQNEQTRRQGTTDETTTASVKPAPAGN
jgi:hypothetical protein